MSKMGNFLQRLHLHETDIAHIAATLNNLVSNTEQLASHLHNAFAHIYIGRKIMYTATTINFNFQSAQEIISKGDCTCLLYTSPSPRD